MPANQRGCRLAEHGNYAEWGTDTTEREFGRARGRVLASIFDPDRVMMPVARRGTQMRERHVERPRLHWLAGILQGDPRGGVSRVNILG